MHRLLQDLALISLGLGCNHLCCWFNGGEMPVFLKTNMQFPKGYKMWTPDCRLGFLADMFCFKIMNRLWVLSVGDLLCIFGIGDFLLSRFF